MLYSIVAVLVAAELYKIFSIQGPPMILQSDNGSEFVNELMKILAESYGIQLVHGRARHPQSQGSVERSNADISKIVYAWMKEKNSKYWSVGMDEMQFQKNARYHSSIKMAPYENVYGQTPRRGLLSLQIDPYLIKRLRTVQDLAANGLYDDYDPNNKVYQ